MKKVLFILAVAATVYACGPSSESTSETDTPVSVQSSPTGDTAITDGGTGAAKGAEGGTDTTSSTTDTTTTNPADTSNSR